MPLTEFKLINRGIFIGKLLLRDQLFWSSPVQLVLAEGSVSVKQITGMKCLFYQWYVSDEFLLTRGKHKRTFSKRRWSRGVRFLEEYGHGRMFLSLAWLCISFILRKEGDFLVSLRYCGEMNRSIESDKNENWLRHTERWQTASLKSPLLWHV